MPRASARRSVCPVPPASRPVPRPFAVQARTKAGRHQAVAAAGAGEDGDVAPEQRPGAPAAAFPGRVVAARQVVVGDAAEALVRARDDDVDVGGALAPRDGSRCSPARGRAR